MPSISDLLKVVVVLLTIRMIAAPVALRPAIPATGHHLNIIVRVCAWPAHRAERLTLRRIAREARESEGATWRDIFQLGRARELSLRLTHARLSQSRLSSLFAYSPSRLHDCLRC